MPFDGSAGSSGSEGLFALGYISRSVIPKEPRILEREVENILRTAQTANAQHGVTGALMYSGGYFCQVMEGDPEHLETLFDAIQRDQRHVDCRVLFFSPITGRNFPEWHMAWAGLDPAAGPVVQGLLNSPRFIATNDQGRALVEHLLDTLRAQSSHVDIAS